MDECILHETFTHFSLLPAVLCYQCLEGVNGYQSESKFHVCQSLSIKEQKHRTEFQQILHYTFHYLLFRGYLGHRLLSAILHFRCTYGKTKNFLPKMRVYILLSPYRKPPSITLHSYEKTILERENRPF